MRRRAVITGIGLITSVGSNRATTWSAVCDGDAGAVAREIDGVGTIAAGAARTPDLDEVIGRRQSRRMDRAGRLAAAAAAEALADAGDLGVDPGRRGVAIGSAHGGAATLDAAFRALHERGADRVSPFSIPLSLVNSPAAATARAHGLRGPSSAPATACAAGADAIGAALGFIRDGRAEVMVAGGADAPLVPIVVAGYSRAGALGGGDGSASRASRPFDESRDGFVIAEGAGVLVIEERERALARGAHVYAELAGYGSSCDAAHLTDPDATGQGPATAIGIALEDAGLSSADVGYVNAHATSTPAGDLAEANAIRAAGLQGALVSSTKGATGHTLGGAGGIEASLSALAIDAGLVPPTAGLVDADPEIPLHLPTEARTTELRAALSNSFGFGGHNTSLVLIPGSER